MTELWAALDRINFKVMSRWSKDEGILKKNDEERLKQLDSNIIPKPSCLK